MATPKASKGRATPKASVSNFHSHCHDIPDPQSTAAFGPRSGSSRRWRRRAIPTSANSCGNSFTWNRIEQRRLGPKIMLPSPPRRFRLCQRNIILIPVPYPAGTWVIWRGAILVIPNETLSPRAPCKRKRLWPVRLRRPGVPATRRLSKSLQVVRRRRSSAALGPLLEPPAASS